MTSTPAKSSGVYRSATGQTIEIRDVWAENFVEEMENVRKTVVDYPFIAMDTEFPGVVARPMVDTNATDYAYQYLKCNVDMLRIIQLGISFSDGDGNFAPGCACWQFNFKFSLSHDMYAQDSIELLRSSGINFQKHEEHGIDPKEFGESLITSGLVLCGEDEDCYIQVKLERSDREMKERKRKNAHDLNDDNNVLELNCPHAGGVTWITFHSSYDFGYLIKLVTDEVLPLDEMSYMELVQIYFPRVFDVKYMMTAVDGLHGGLSRVAEDLGLERIGTQHTAGSDSLLTAQPFFEW